MCANFLFALWFLSFHLVSSLRTALISSKSHWKNIVITTYHLHHLYLHPPWSRWRMHYMLWHMGLKENKPVLSPCLHQSVGLSTQHHSFLNPAPKNTSLIIQRVQARNRQTWSILSRGAKSEDAVSQLSFIPLRDTFGLGVMRKDHFTVLVEQFS